MEEPKVDDLTKDFYTTGEVADMFGVSAQTIRRWSQQGYIEAGGVKQRRISIAEVKRLRDRFKKPGK